MTHSLFQSSFEKLPNYKVIVQKFDLKNHYDWEPKLLYFSQDFIWTLSIPGRVLNHHTKSSQFQFDTYSMEFFYPNLWYSFNSSYHPEKKVISFYCNIHKPIEFNQNFLSFVDLDLDVINKPSTGVTIVDQDEFEVHQKTYQYDQDTIKRVPKEAESVKHILNYNKYFSTRFHLDMYQNLIQRSCENTLNHYLSSFKTPPKLN